MKKSNFLVFIGVIVVIAVLFSAKDIKNRVLSSKIGELVEESDSEELMKNRDEREKNTSTDIEGMSAYDKRMDYLSPYDGADTDGDGLTDKEEIEVYGSDPHLASTAGDLYTDGYKVENGLDINEKIEKTAEYSDFANASLFPAEVYPNPEDINDIVELNAYIVRADYNKFENLDKKDVYAVYEIRNFYGAIAIDTTAIIPENGKIGILYIDGENTESVDYIEQESMIAFDSSVNGDGYYAICSKKSHLFKNDKLSNTVDSVSELAENAIYNSPDHQPKFIVEQWQLRNNLFCERPTVFYVSGGNADYDEKYIGAITHSIDYMFGNGLNFTGLIDRENSSDRHLKRENFEKITYSEYLIKRAALDKKKTYIPFFIHDYAKFKEDEDECYLFYGCMTDEDLPLALTGDKSAELGLNFANWAVIGEDTLPFGNFGSYISDGGNCAGFAAFTATLYNTGSFPEKGEYDSDRLPGGHISYDLTTDEENKTLMDRYLSDYKDESFVTEHYDYKKGTIDNNTLSEGEQQFVDMIGMYWAKSNDTREESVNSGKTPLLYSDKYEVANYTYEEFLPVEMFYKMNASKMYVLSVDGYNKNGENSAHAVNIVGIEWEDKYYSIDCDEEGNITKQSEYPTGGTIILKIYDNNHPKEIREAIVNVRPSKNDRFVGVCSLDFEFAGYYTDHDDNNSRRVVIMDETLTPIEFTPVIEVGKAIGDEDGNLVDIDFEHGEDYLQKYLNTYPSRRFFQDKELYNSYIRDGLEDIGNGDFAK